MLGLIALWAIIFKRNKLTLVLRVFTATLINEKLRRIRETITKLETTSYDEKQNKPIVQSLIGQLCGQIGSMVSNGNGLQKIHDRLAAMLDSKTAVSEPHKQRLLAELNAELDNISISHTSNLLK